MLFYPKLSKLVPVCRNYTACKSWRVFLRHSGVAYKRWDHGSTAYDEEMVMMMMMMMTEACNHIATEAGCWQWPTKVIVSSRLARGRHFCWWNRVSSAMSCVWTLQAWTDSLFQLNPICRRSFDTRPSTQVSLYISLYIIIIIIIIIIFFFIIKHV